MRGFEGKWPSRRHQQMVLHSLITMIASITTLPVAPRAQSVMTDGQLRHIVEFRGLAARGLSSRTQESVQPESRPISNRFDSRFDCFEPSWGTTTMIYLRSANQIVLFSLNEDPRKFEPATVAVDDAQLIVLSGRYARAAGFDPPMTMESIQDGEEEYPTKLIKCSVRYRGMVR
jgi:hypothetical protein